MTVKHIYYCDGPFNPGWPEHETCPVHHSEPEIQVTWGSLRRRYLYFCSWDCVLRYAAQIEPVEVIEA